MQYLKCPFCIYDQNEMTLKLSIFCDSRYGRVFTYHNGAQSYYSTREFHSLLKI